MDLEESDIPQISSTPTDEAHSGESIGSKLGNNLVEFIEFAAVTIAILVVIRFFIAEPHKVSGHSMDNNFHDGDLIITNKVSLKFSNPARGEVIILHNPLNPDQVFIKRVIGLPNERVKLLNGQFYINDQLLPEPYLPSGLKTPGENFLIEGAEIIVPKDQYFVAGDNRPASSDSREWGTVKRDLIIGQALIRYWPLSRAGVIQIDQQSLKP